MPARPGVVLVWQSGVKWHCGCELVRSAFALVKWGKIPLDLSQHVGRLVLAGRGAPGGALAELGAPPLVNGGKRPKRPVGRRTAPLVGRHGTRPSAPYVVSVCAHANSTRDALASMGRTARYRIVTLWPAKW